MDLQQYDLDCEAKGCDFPAVVEVEVGGNDKGNKYTMSVCESHAELMHRGIPFKTSIITNKQ